MAHQLAAAICDLAAPPVKPTFLRIILQMEEGNVMPCAAVLHTRGRGGSAEASVHTGYVTEPFDPEPIVNVSAPAYLLPSSAAGVDLFARDLVASLSWPHPMQAPLTDQICSLTPPAQYNPALNWTSAELALIPEDAVKARPHEPGPGDAGAEPQARLCMGVEAPTLGGCEMPSACALYASQHAHMIPGTRGRGSPAEYAAKYERLRQEDAGRCG